MYNIVVCIPTYKRPLMLEKLILSIINGSIDKLLIKTVHILIADNDVDKTAEITVKELIRKFEKSYDIQYFNHPSKGITNIRNELIKRALLLNPEFLVFIDDDEYVTSEWLNELVKTMINNNADAARGPVIPVVDDSFSRYISYWVSQEEHFPDNALLPSLFTGNLILRVSSLKAYNVWFDSRFNIIGSSDIYFGIQIFKKGAKLYWASRAIAYETITENKAKLLWLIRRSFRGASTLTYIYKLEKEYYLLFRKLIISGIYLISGSFATILVIIPFKQKYWGILKFFEGIGGIAGVFNLLYKEYK